MPMYERQLWMDIAGERSASPCVGFMGSHLISGKIIFKPGVHQPQASTHLVS